MEQQKFPEPTATVSSIIVTGGTGFVGSAIIRALLVRHPQCRIIVYDATINQATNAYRGIIHPNVTFIEGNIADTEQLNKTFQQAKPEAVVHTAGFVPPLSERHGRRLEKQAFAINLGGTRKVLEAAKRAGVKAFVYTSSCCVVIDDVSQDYANIDERWPVVTRGTASIYAESKAEAEFEVLKASARPPASPATESDKDSDTVIVENGSLDDEQLEMLTSSIRPAVIFGEHDHQLVPSILSCILDKHESLFQVGNGLNLWDTVYVGNVADAHVLALENLLAHFTSKPPAHSAAGEAFFVQDNTPISFREFCLQVWKTYNGHIPPLTVPIPKAMAWALGWVMELVTWCTGAPSTLTRGSVTDATAIRYASGEKARLVLGYVARVDMEEGLRRGCEEYKKRRQREGHPRSNGEVLVERMKEFMEKI